MQKKFIALITKTKNYLKLENKEFAKYAEKKKRKKFIVKSKK